MITVDTELTSILNSIQSGLKQVTARDGITFLEFQDGNTVNLAGGGYVLHSAPACSFCGLATQHLMAPPRQDTPLICPSCAVAAIETFAKNGIRIELNLTI